MTTLPPTTLDRIRREAEEKYPTDNLSIMGVQHVKTTYQLTHIIAATAEATRAEKLEKALELLVHLHLCEQEGIDEGMPTPKQWYEAVEQAEQALEEYRK